MSEETAKRIEKSMLLERRTRVGKFCVTMNFLVLFYL